MPEDEPTVAIPVLLLLHTPPADASLSVVELYSHIVVVPVIAGIVLTVTIAVVVQPVPNV
jgi:hypothetical protein